MTTRTVATDAEASEASPAPRLPPRWFIRLFWVAHRVVYAITGGRIGLRRVKPDQWGMLRLRTIGRRSGEERKAIVGYLEDGSDLVTLATNGMAARTPAWWRNLLAHPDTTVDLPGGSSRSVRAREASDDERLRLWALWVDQGGDLDAHAASRGLEIPVVILEPRA
jgi:deazaflavin-dependent oxidoreductase (nitroreductase family)